MGQCNVSAWRRAGYPAGQCAAIVDPLEIGIPLLQARIPDWRAKVDDILIDTAYDGEVFNIELSDVPRRKTTSSLAATNFPRLMVAPA